MLLFFHIHRRPRPIVIPAETDPILYLLFPSLLQSDIRRRIHERRKP